jgi:small subunit ribosomal protein S15
MAKMHSRARGTSGSKQPLEPKAPWVRYQPKEIEMLVAKLAKEGNTTSKIGIVLRDSYGVPDAKLITGKPILQMLREKKLEGELPEDMVALMKRALLVRKHLGLNKHDFHAGRGLLLVESKIRRLAKYYKSIGRLPPTWKYDFADIKKLVS